MVPCVLPETGRTSNRFDGRRIVVSKLHFISGLPRSGSTLLCAVLRQNPRFAASIVSPIASLCDLLTREMSGSSEFVTLFDNERRQAILRGIFDAYYADAKEQIVFDTNRAWTGKTGWLGALFPDARIICCVRDVGWIIDSMERILRANPLQLSRTFAYKAGSSIYARVEMLMNSETGLIGLPWSTLREAWFGECANRLIVIPYDTLVREPRRILDRLYEALREPYFPHDFGQVSFDAPEYDVQLGMPGLHKVQPIVKPTQRTATIPPDLFVKYAEASFWLKPELNHRGVQIL